MKDILHSGSFLDYDGNTITVTFYTQTHLWVSNTSIWCPYTGGDYEVEVWSDSGSAEIAPSQYSWITLSEPKTYTNKYGYVVSRYTITIEGRNFVGVPNQRGSLSVRVIGDDLKKTISITRQ